MRSLGAWHEEATGAAAAEAEAEAEAEAAAAAAASAPAAPPPPREGDEGAAPRGESLEAWKASKRAFEEGVAAFNAHPRKGVKVLVERGLCGPEPADVARFLASSRGLDKAQVRGGGATRYFHFYYFISACTSPDPAF
jgi:hypothetical protein